VPVLIARPAVGDPPWPAVLWYHGFTADRNASRPELETLAKVGFLAVGVDAVGHGARWLPDFDERFAGSGDHGAVRELLTDPADSSKLDG
jgi:cephalosporin-C deacetylase-like acetyl esterase